MKRTLAASAMAMMASEAIAQNASDIVPDTVVQGSPALDAYTQDNLLADVWKGEELSTRDRALATFAVLVARNETGAIGGYTSVALDSGVTPAEISEAITHLAFYTGWGNAVSATQSVAPVFEARSISSDDLPSPHPTLLPLDEKEEAARQNLVQNNYGNVSQGVVDNTEQLLFRDLWLRPGLAPRDRSLVTVAALIATGQPEQMTFHFNRAMDNGLTQEEAGALLSHLAFYVGWPRVFSAMPVAKSVFENRSN